jgi:hypothetical protein
MAPALNENDVLRVYRVAFIGGSFGRGASQRGFIGILRFVAMPADELLADLDSNQPSIPVLITGYFYTVCFHPTKIWQTCCGGAITATTGE